MIAVPMRTADDGARRGRSSARARPGARCATFTARPTRTRLAKSGSPRRSAGSAAAKSGRTRATARGTVTLSSSVVGSDSTRAQARARAQATPIVRGQWAAPGSRGERATQAERKAAAARAAGHEGGEADPALARVPREARAAHRLAHERGHPVAHGEDAPARGGHPQAVPEEQDEGEHGERVGEDAHRVAARRRPAPRHIPFPPTRGRTCQLKRKAPRARSAACHHVSQRRRSAKATQPTWTTLRASSPRSRLTRRSRRAERAPGARSQRTVSRSPSASGRHS